MSQVDSRDEMEKEQFKKRVLSVALGEGVKYGAAGFIIVGSGILIASMASRKFNKLVPVSAMSSLPIMSGLALFSFKYETVSHNAQRHPENWGLDESQSGKISLPAHLKAYNMMYDYPRVVLATSSFPFLFTVVMQQIHTPVGATIKDRVVRSRGIATKGLLSVTLLMTIYSYLKTEMGRISEE